MMITVGAIFSTCTLTSTETVVFTLLLPPSLLRVVWILVACALMIKGKLRVPVAADNDHVSVSRAGGDAVESTFSGDVGVLGTMKITFKSLQLTPATLP